MWGNRAKLIAFLPEAALALVFGGLILTISNLGSQSARYRAVGEQTARAAGAGAAKQLAQAQAAAERSPSRIVAPEPAAVILPPAGGTGQVAAVTPGAIAAGQADPKSQAAAKVIPDPTRIEHARELLGKFYERSVVKNGERVAEVDKFVREWTERALKRKDKKFTRVISDTVLTEAEKYGFDPVFLMAVIENESSFNSRAIGPVGEIGLMQVTATTGKWIAQKFKIKWAGKRSLYDPRTNIRIGAAYLSYLREEFDSHSRLYLAAYNMGATNVNRALEKSVWPKDYPQRVMKRYLRFYGDLKAELKSAAASPKS